MQNNKCGSVIFDTLYKKKTGRPIRRQINAINIIFLLEIERNICDAILRRLKRGMKGHLLEFYTVMAALALL